MEWGLGITVLIRRPPPKAPLALNENDTAPAEPHLESKLDILNTWQALSCSTLNWIFLGSLWGKGKHKAT
jgi:hypothetical protein